MKKLTTSQICEWEAYDSLEPIGTYWSDYRMAYLCSFLTNVANSLYHEEGVIPELTYPTDFMHVYDREEMEEIREAQKKQQSIEQIRKAALAMVADQIRKVDSAEGKRVRKPKPIQNEHRTINS